MAGEKIVADMDSETIDETRDRPYADHTNAAIADLVFMAVPDAPLRAELGRRLRELTMLQRMDRERMMKEACCDGPEPARLTEDERLSAMCLFGSLMGAVGALEMGCDPDTARLIERAIRYG